jgi:hypothetical protein
MKMKKGKNPVYRKGNRNALCPHYRTCLDMAVKKSWEFWDCCECRFQSSRDPDMNVLRVVNHDVAIYDLPAEFYHKF